MLGRCGVRAQPNFGISGAVVSTVPPPGLKVRCRVKEYSLSLGLGEYQRVTNRDWQVLFVTLL